MVKIKAIKLIKDNQKHIIGVEVFDMQGKSMRVRVDAFVQAVQAGKVSIDGLSLEDKVELNKVFSVDKSNTTVSRTATPTKVNATNTEVAGTVNTGSTANSNQSDMTRMKNLVDELNKARKVYEQGTDEIMSNKEYDDKYDELLALEAKLNTVLPNSPTHNVGYEVVSKLEKITHERQMLSLDKTKEISALKSWLSDKQGVLSWKLDGLTVVLTYNNGILVQAVTRGNGTVGEDVTNNAKTFVNLPVRIAYTGKLTLRGEAVIGYSTFNKINSTITNEDDKYKNPRNLCSGSVRQLDSSVTAQRDVKWYAFDVVQTDKNDWPLGKSYNEQMTKLEQLGFETVERKLVTSSNIETAINEFKQAIKTYDIPSDGLVLAYDDREYGYSLGVTSKFPRHSIAFKWQDETAITQLKNIAWQVGRSGIITPVAEFEPVELEGTTVERATLHNMSILVSTLGQPYVGQNIEVYKANMIIPNVLSGEIMENVPDNIALNAPNYCPRCGEETELKQDPNSGVYTLWCNNVDCPARGSRVLKHFVERDCMNIDGLSSAKLDLLVENGLVDTFASLYQLEQYEYEIINIEGFGQRSYDKLISAIDKSRQVYPHNLIFALGIPNIGLSTAKLICKHFDNDIDEIINADAFELSSIDGIGDVIAQSFCNYFADEDNMSNFNDLVEELDIIKPESSSDSSMAGVTICVTGDVYVFSNRRVIKDLVERLGGKLTGSVSKSTSYLVTNDTTSGSKKNKAAQAYGIPILTEQEFIDKFNLSGYVS